MVSLLTLGDQMFNQDFSSEHVELIFNEKKKKTFENADYLYLNQETLPGI